MNCLQYRKRRVTGISQRVLTAALCVMLTVGMMPQLTWADDTGTSGTQAGSATEVVTGSEQTSATNTQEVSEATAETTETTAEAAKATETQITTEPADATAGTTDAAGTAEAATNAAEEEALEAESTYEPLDIETITLDSGTKTGNTSPYLTYHQYIGFQTLYTASELNNTAGKITSLAYYVATASTYEQSEFKIYLGTTEQTSLSKTSALGANDLTLVYSNDSQTLGAKTGWETITLNTAYKYDGTKNLVVAIYRKAESKNSSLYYQYKYEDNSGKNIYCYSDSNTAYGEVTAPNYYDTFYTPNIQFTINTCAHETLTHHNAETPMCGSGNVEYWSCDNCGDYFSDAAGKNPLSSIKAEHSWGTGVENPAPTCKETGTMVYTCTECGAEKTEVIPATKKHNFVDGKCTNLLRDGSTVCGALDQWDGTTLTEPITDENGTYLIGDAEEFAWFMNAATASKYAGNAKLTRNINMGTLSTWYLTGSAGKDNGYQGTFDGNGYTITINYASSSNHTTLFGHIGQNGVIENLTVKGSFTAKEKSAAGFAYSNYGTIQNCINEATVTATSTSTTNIYAGGFVAYANYGTLKQCANYGEVTASTSYNYGSTYAGGIVAYSNTGSGISNVVKDCYNAGTVGAAKVSTSSSKYAYAGGITGYVHYAYATYSFEKCLNTGSIQASNSADPTSENGLMAGGIAGGIYYSSSYVSKIMLTNCFYLEGSANVAYNSTSTGNKPATATNCGTTNSDNIASASWLTENLDNWFIELLGVAGTQYTVTFSASNATVTLNGATVTQPVQAYEGATLTFTVTPAGGYGIDSVKQGDAELSPADDGTYTTGAITGSTTISIATHQHAWDSGAVTTPATCVNAGVTTYKCTATGCTASYTEPIAATGDHTPTLTATAEVPATCTTAGTKAYWFCSGCNQYFSDEGCTTVIAAPETIAALGHNYTAYRNNGNGTHNQVCSRCNKEKPGEYTISSTATTTMTAGKTYVITVAGTSGSTMTAMSCEASTSIAYWLKGVSYTAGTTAVDTTLLWTWGENGSLQSVYSGQYLNAVEGEKAVELYLQDTCSTAWKLDSNGMLYYTSSSGESNYLVGIGGTAVCVYSGGRTPASEAFYEATALETAEACEYGTNGTCTKCGATQTVQTITVDSSIAYTTTPYVSVTSGTSEEGDEGASKTSLYLVTATVSYLAEGYVPVVGETALIKDSQDESGTTYKALVSADIASGISAGTLHISAAQGTAVASTPAIKGDVNTSSKLNIVDAQVAYDMACGHYSTSVLPLANFLAADVNADNELSSADAFAIQHAVVFGWSASASTAGDNAENNDAGNTAAA